MRILPLASGSSGNCTFVEAAGKRLLIDIGFAAPDVEALLEGAGIAPRTIDAALLTHRHRDHVRGATDFCRKHRVRIYTARRTSRSLGSECRRWLRILRPMEWSELGDADAAVRVLPIPVEHDAPDTLAFLIEADSERYGHVTDLGTARGPIGETLTNCDELFLEFNHDPEMLASCRVYPPVLKQRIAGPTGHLSNRAAADLLARLAHPRLRRVWVGHISERTNTPELAVAAARRAVGTNSEVCPVAPVATSTRP